MHHERCQDQRQTAGEKDGDGRAARNGQPARHGRYGVQLAAEPGFSEDARAGADHGDHEGAGKGPQRVGLHHGRLSDHREHGRDQRVRNGDRCQQPGSRSRIPCP